MALSQPLWLTLLMAMVALAAGARAEDVPTLSTLDGNVTLALESGKEAALARQNMINSTTFAALENRVTQLEGDSVTQTELAEDLDQVLVDVSELLDEELAYVYGNLSLINSSFANTSFNANSNAILSCFSQGLVYDGELDRCVPTFLHQGCHTGGPNLANTAASDCSGTGFDDTCTITCVPGFSAGTTIVYRCNALAEWVPTTDQALACVDIDECASENACPAQATCINLPGSYECRCPGGFTVAPTEQSCYGLYLEFLEQPEMVQFQFTGNCQKLQRTISNTIPTNAVAVLASLTFYNSQQNDHCVYSLGRDNNVACYNYDNEIYTVDGYFGDILQTQNGDAGGAQHHGYSAGTTIIPLNGRTIKALVGGMSRGYNYLAVYIYGYLTGAARSTLLDVGDIQTLKRQSSSAERFDFTLDTTNLPLTNISGLLTTTTTYVSTQDDQYALTPPRLQPSFGATWYRRTMVIASEATDTYGKSKFMMTGTLDDGTTNVNAGSGFNNNGEMYLSMAVFGYIPAVPYTNIVYLDRSKSRKLTFAPTQRTVQTGISAPTESGVPADAIALITTIHTFEPTDSSDHVVHTFGRDATHTINAWGINIYNFGSRFNDVQITHDGGSGADSAYGIWHGTQIIPLKPDGTFDAVMCDGESTPGKAHDITIVVVGYIASL
ncbi:uncharacterized protein MONBRDRAFT_24014 [Monosiga brevicollis MX1]|uniref:EGF-like domain-containing protein n=1 Tax=Monosiga brevicollis TaxID=81824 RepID=A9UUG0_MONBE|nr:uncharacterized protein MONBRDRAFT_24014 [Monosiga brevicollis MX1]EDQ90895.1 predicted protein [Monosiga brevicollis MX1]|eukprot:XP_001744192.1 hypothetical protein [Monosiga brevicollis MX1]